MIRSPHKSFPLLHERLMKNFADYPPFPSFVFFFLISRLFLGKFQLNNYETVQPSLLVCKFGPLATLIVEISYAAFAHSYAHPFKSIWVFKSDYIYWSTEQ